jgi:hypothetical protein
VIEVQAMETNLVTVKTLNEKLKSSSHVKLDGIYFENGKSTMSSKSEAALKNI